MPYIPPPRPPAPPAPPRIPTPVFRPPQQNFHFQQQQRLQQQQHFQQQQRFHQQQVLRHQQQHQEQIRRLHQNIQMDNQRRQQLHQQQLQRQQQQQIFQRQQEEFRRQQQDHLRRQQQDNLRRQEQQRQQELLRNFQRSTAIGGNTVVHIAPGFTFEVSGLTTNPAVASDGSGGIEITYNGSQLSGEGMNAASSQPQDPPPHASLQQSPPNSAGAREVVGPPPPYSEPSVPKPPLAQPSPIPAQDQPTSASQQPDNRIILKDGTQIVLHQEDEILFIGPTGIQMVVNCLPLYEPPDEEAQAVATENETARQPFLSYTGARTTLIKARSMESISSSQLGDEETDLTVGGGATPPRRKSASKFTHHSAMVNNLSPNSAHSTSDGATNSTTTNTTTQPITINDDTEPTIIKATTEPASNDTAKPTFTSGHGNGIGAAGVQENDAKQAKAKDEVTKECDGEITEESEPVGSVRLETAVLKPDIEQPEGESTSVQVDGNNSANGSSTKEKEEHEGCSRTQKGIVENSDVANSLEESEEVKQKPKEEENSEQHERTRFRSVRQSLSPEGDMSDSEENAFSVNFVQDPVVLPQLKRSSGSVSFYAPPAEVGAIAIKSDHSIGRVLLEMSGENKLEDERTEKGEEAVKDVTGTEEASRTAASPTNREKSLSTAKPALVEEADSILQKSASSVPSAPVQTSTSHSTSPPSSGKDTAQAPPSSKGQPALRASPLPHPPITLDRDYTERSGWLNKLSHRKGMFGDKWQKRYFVLHRSWLYYFKKYGDSNPKGVIRLLPTGWCRSIPQGTKRMSDAVVNRSEQTSALISVLRCLAVHRPNNFAASLSALLGAEGVAETFRSQTVSVSNTQHSSRTFYMIAASNEERDAWITAINRNFKAYAYSGEALDTACKELKKMLRAVQSNIAQKDIPAILLLLTTKMKKVAEEQRECSSSSSTHGY